MDGVVDDARIRGNGWSAVRDLRALRAERRLLALGLTVVDPRTTMSANLRGTKMARHVPLLEVVHLCERLRVADVFNNVLDALHFKLGMCCEETDGDELGAGWTGSGFGALRCGCDQRMGAYGCAHVRFFALGGGWSSGVGESEEEVRVPDVIPSPPARFLPLWYKKTKKVSGRR